MSLVSAISQPAAWLDDVAARLKVHSWVADARMDPVAGGACDRAAGRATVSIVPSAAGVRALRTAGKGWMTAELGRWLQSGGCGDVPEVEFRLVESLATDGTDSVDARAARGWMPLIDEVALDERGLGCVLRVPYELPIFRGHFPGRPIVPGVMQIGWAASLARAHGLADGPLVGIPAAKFNRIVRPGMRLAARIERGTKAGQVQFQYRSGDIAITTGRLQFGDARD